MTQILFFSLFIQIYAISVDEFVQDIFQKYDIDRNGKIIFGSVAFRKDLHNEYNRKEVILGSEKCYSRKDLFDEADENEDGILLESELLIFVKQYDTNGDGLLDSRGVGGTMKSSAFKELDLLEREYGEEDLFDCP